LNLSIFCYECANLIKRATHFKVLPNSFNFNGDVLLSNLHLIFSLQNLKQQLCKAHESIDSLKQELVAVNSEAKKREENLRSLKENLNEKDKEIEHIKEQRNKLAKGECESQLAYDIIYNEAVQERENALER